MISATYCDQILNEIFDSRKSVQRKTQVNSFIRFLCSEILCSQCDHIKRRLVYSLNTTTDPQTRVAKLKIEAIPLARLSAPQRHPRTKRRIEEERETAPATTRKCAPSFLHASGLSFCSQFHQHFTSCFCANFLSPKKYKPKPEVQKSCLKDFCTKKMLVKCWDTWKQIS